MIQKVPKSSGIDSDSGQTNAVHSVVFARALVVSLDINNLIF